jgi:hypothetical protein
MKMNLLVQNSNGLEVMANRNGGSGGSNVENIDNKIENLIVSSSTQLSIF